MTTQWTKRLYAVVPVGINPGQKQALAQAFANNGSGQSEEAELELFDVAPRFSSDGNEPASHIGINTAAKTGMATAIAAVTNGAGGDSQVQDYDNVTESFSDFITGLGLQRIESEV